MSDTDSIDEAFDLDELRPRFPDFERPPDPRLAAEGWERRFMADARRAEEYASQYAAMGFEVRVEPVRPAEVGPECGDCSLIVNRLFVTLYTRRRGSIAPGSTKSTAEPSCPDGSAPFAEGG